MKIPDELTADVIPVTWLNIQGPIEIMSQLNQWIYERGYFPLTRCGGSGSPCSINMAFTNPVAQRVIAQVLKLKGKVNYDTEGNP